MSAYYCLKVAESDEWKCHSINWTEVLHCDWPPTRTSFLSICCTIVSLFRILFFMSDQSTHFDGFVYLSELKNEQHKWFVCKVCQNAGFWFDLIWSKCMLIEHLCAHKITYNFLIKATQCQIKPTHSNAIRFWFHRTNSVCNWIKLICLCDSIVFITELLVLHIKYHRLDFHCIRCVNWNDVRSILITLRYTHYRDKVIFIRRPMEISNNWKRLCKLGLHRRWFSFFINENKMKKGKKWDNRQKWFLFSKKNGMHSSLKINIGSISTWTTACHLNWI